MKKPAIANFTGDPATQPFYILYGQVTKDSDGVLTTTMVKGDNQGIGGTTYWSRWMLYGTISAKMKVGRGGGVVSSFIMRSGSTSNPDDPSSVEDEVMYKSINIYLFIIYFYLFDETSFHHYNYSF